MAKRLRVARTCGGGSDAAVAAMGGASEPAGGQVPTDSLMQAIRSLGRLPKETRTASSEERKLARNLRKARTQGQVSAEAVWAALLRLLEGDQGF